MVDGLGAAYDIGVRAVLITDQAAPTGTDEAIEIAGIRMLGRSDWAGAVAAFGRPLDLELLVLDAAGVADGVLAETLPILDDRARRQNVQIVVSFGESQIDAVTAHLFGREVHLLCAPSMAERVAALALAGGVRLDAAVSEIGQDAQAARLRRLNEEVARIAETLARLTRDDGVVERPIPTLGDRRNGYGAPPAEDGVGAHDLRQAIRSRRLRAQFFEPSLLEDPAWDMLLDLYAAELERAQVSVSSLCIAAAVAPTTALRWIAKMTDAGLLERQPDPFDRRRAFMALSGTARAGLRGYFAAVKRAGLSIA